MTVRGILSILVLLLLTQSSFAQSIEQKLSELEQRIEVLEQAMASSSLPESNKDLSRPSLSQSELNAFVAEALSTSFSLDFVKYNQQIRKASQFYTANGQIAYDQVLSQSKLIESIIREKFMLKSSITDPGVIKRKGVHQGLHYWQLEVPLQLNYQSANKQFDETAMCQIVIVRAHQKGYPSGVAIEQISFKRS